MGTMCATAKRELLVKAREGSINAAHAARKRLRDQAQQEKIDKASEAGEAPPADQPPEPPPSSRKPRRGQFRSMPARDRKQQEIEVFGGVHCRAAAFSDTDRQASKLKIGAQPGVSRISRGRVRVGCHAGAPSGTTPKKRNRGAKHDG